MSRRPLVQPVLFSPFMFTQISDPQEVAANA